MNLIVCSVPGTIPDEQQLVQELLHQGLETFHLRKPTFTIGEMRNWLQEMQETDLRHVVLHSHWTLAEEFQLKGIHIGATTLKNITINGQQAWLTYAKRNGLTISSSVHDQEEINRLPEGLDYVWLSPLFESISKQAYRSIYSAEQFDAWQKELKKTKQTQVYALGGITAQHLQKLIQRGFDGAVVLGSVWLDVKGIEDQELVKQRLKELAEACKTDPIS